MTKQKVNRYVNFFKNKEGMALFEFMIVCFLCFIFVALLLEFGFALRSEAILVAVTNKAVRETEITGELDTTKIHEKLSSYGIDNVNVSINDSSLKFRDDFKLTVTGTHKMNMGGVLGPGVNVPLVFAAHGQVEKYTY